jgi:hypothetical protein
MQGGSKLRSSSVNSMNKKYAVYSILVQLMLADGTIKITDKNSFTGSVEYEGDKYAYLKEAHEYDIDILFLEAYYS